MGPTSNDEVDEDSDKKDGSKDDWPPESIWISSKSEIQSDEGRPECTEVTRITTPDQRDTMLIEQKSINLHERMKNNHTEKEGTNQNANADQCIYIGKISSDRVFGCVEKSYGKSSDEDGNVQPGNPGFVKNKYDIE